MIHPGDLVGAVIRPTLEELGLFSPAAANLLLATAVVESSVGDVQHLRQRARGGGYGPAVGIYQIEPATHRDQWDNCLSFRLTLATRVRAMALDQPPWNDEELAWNLRYATAIARVKYWRDPAALPAPDDLEALGAYWKRVYNTPAGAGTIEHFLHKAAPLRPYFLSD